MVAGALSGLFDGTGDDGRPGRDVVLPFEPKHEWPELFQYPEELHRMRETGEKAKLVDLGGEFRGIDGVVIMRDSENEEVWPDANPRRR